MFECIYFLSLLALQSMDPLRNAVCTASLNSRKRGSILECLWDTSVVWQGKSKRLLSVLFSYNGEKQLCEGLGFFPGFSLPRYFLVALLHFM